MWGDILACQCLYGGIGGLTPVGSESFDSAVTGLLRRARDADAKFGDGDRTEAEDILLECMRLVNVHHRLVVSSATMTTTAGTVFYAVSTELTDASRVISVRDGNRDISEMPWRQLMTLEPNILDRRGHRHDVWAAVGRDMIALWPAKSEDSTVTVRFVTILDKPADLDTTVDLSQEAMVKAVDLAEEVLLVQHRYLEVAAQRFADA